MIGNRFTLKSISALHQHVTLICKHCEHELVVNLIILMVLMFKAQEKIECLSCNYNR